MKIFQQPKRLKTAIIGVTASALILAPPIAMAHGGDYGGDYGDHSRHVSTPASRAVAATQEGKPTSFRQRDTDRQKLTCDQKQQLLNQRAADAKTRLTKRLTGLNIMLNGVQTYVSSGGINVPNYDALNTAATNDQAAATAAINAIAAPQLNCPDPTAASAEATDDNLAESHDNSLNSGIGNAQKALMTYRKDLNKLFEAVIDSSANS